MIVVALCDGVATGLQALKDEGFKVDKYYAFEINKHAIKVAKSRHPEIIQLGDLRNWEKSLPKEVKPDLILAGVECKNWSVAGKQEGAKEGSSGDLIVYASEMLWMLNPMYYLFEMTPMKKYNERIFNLFMRGKPCKIDSSDFSMQSRKRNYYTNIPIKEVLISQGQDVQMLANGNGTVINYSSSGRGVKGVEFRESVAKRALTLTKGGYGNRSRTFIRRPDGTEQDLTIEQLEILQTMPIGYTEGISLSQRKIALGNGWNKQTIQHILKNIDPKFKIS